MRTVLHESYADHVRRESNGKEINAAEQLPQIEWTSESSAYDTISPRISKTCEEPKDLTGTPARRFRLSRSPLDNLQAEFRRYGRQDARFQDVVNCLSTHRIHVPHELKDIDESELLNGSEDETSCPDNFEHSEPALVVPDWSYVQRTLEDADYVQDECPSMTTGSTIGSRNSSTRSARSIRTDGAELADKGMCPIPECGRMFRDLAAHMITHRAERPEKCPIPACEYHTKGFARAYDRVRHTLTHFKGTMVCGFCNATSADITFGRCDVFLRHLVSAHGVEQVPLSRREELFRTGTIRQPCRPLDGQHISTCQLCSEPFDVQGFYEHLRGCVLRQVTSEPNHVRSLEHVQQDFAKTSLLGVEAPRGDSVSSPVEQYIIMPMSTPSKGDEVLTNVSRSYSPVSQTKAETSHHSLAAETREIAELTASSRCLSLTSSHDETFKSSDEETDWTEEAGSPYSELDADGLRPLLSPVKRQLVDALMAEFHRIFDKMLRMHGGGSSSGTGGYIGSSGSSTYSSSSFISRKRSLSGGSTPPDGDGDDPHKRRKPDPKSTGGKQPTSELRFACPYYKRNPGRHQTYTSCRDPGFNTVARLKEHLYRRHLLPIQCHRCCSTFPNEPTLRDHQRDARGCEIREQVPPEGFDKDQERKLKSKKRSLVYQSEEDKWKGVYRILFPDDVEEAMPSPYIEYQPCNTNQAGESSNVARFQEFSRLELPRLVRRTLEVAVEEEAQPLEDKLKERLVDIVRECQSQLFTMFQTTQAPSHVGAAHVALISAQDTTSGKPAEPAHTNNVPTTELPFRGFDSTASMEADFMTMPAALHDVAEHPKFEDATEGSPDSGYDSAWHGAGVSTTGASNTFHQDNSFASSAYTFDQATMFEQQLNYMPGTTFMSNDYTESEYVDLGGYYGLFENRDRNVDMEVLDPAWGYTTAGGGNSTGSLG